MMYRLRLWLAKAILPNQKPCGFVGCRNAVWGTYDMPCPEHNPEGPEGVARWKALAK